MNKNRLMDSTWLAERLGVSLSTIQKLRAYHPHKLPKAVRIGRAVRYDPETVESWIMDNMQEGV
ncbi:helix-turn-helix transcriptional regulator [Amphritea sp.]|uniref:helix-turn-helix transcriptional regulator n=1 Tax=Amphritea sp. TaxID=1872502 RepID=UPI003A941C6F